MRSTLLFIAMATLCGCVFEEALDDEADELRDQADRATEALRLVDGEPVGADDLETGGPEVASFYSPAYFRVGAAFQLRITPRGSVDEVASVVVVIDHASAGLRVPARVESGALVVSGEITDATHFDSAIRLASVALVDAEGRRGESAPMPLDLRADEERPEAEFRTLAGVAPRVHALAFPPAGAPDFLVAGGGGGVLVRWSLGLVGRPVKVYRADDETVRIARIANRGRHLASASDDGKVRVFDLASGDAVRTFDAHVGVVPALAFAPDDNALVSGGWDGFVRVHRLDTGELAEEIDVGARVNAVAFSPDGRHFLVASGRPLVPGRVTLVELATRERRDWSDFDREATAVAFSPTGSHFAVGFGRGAVRVWATAAPADAEPLLLDPVGTDVVQGVVFPEGRVIAATLNGYVGAWDIVDGAILDSQDTGEILLSVALSADLDVLALGNVDGVVRTLDFTPFRDAFDRRRAPPMRGR